MPSLFNDPITQIAFSVYENKGVFGILLGSGVSRAAEIPTGWEITLDLVRRVALASGVAEQPDWATWYWKSYKKEPNYSELLEALATTREERRSILESYLEPTEEDREQGKKVPTLAHKTIASLVQAGYIKVIITTNFDRLMENALREQGVEPTVIASEDALHGAEPLTHSKCYLFKIHGDYKDTRILNTESELNTYPERYQHLLDRIFDEYGLIVCGWSGEWDHALQAAILRTPSRRYPTYWTQRGELGSGAKTLIEHRRAKEVAIEGADQLFTALQQQVTTLQLTHRRHPQSIDLLISITKRFLSKSEYRIQLHDLIADEAAKTQTQLEAETFNAQAPVDAAEFQKRVAFYEANTESLARMVSVLGRWGNGSELNSVVEIIRAQYAHAESVGNGYTIWLGLRSYPSVLIFTAYGIGLVRAQRWKVLHDFFCSKLSISSRENPVRLVEVLLLQAWKGDENDDWWQFLKPSIKLKTPFSDHLHELTSSWKKSFEGLDANFDVLFGRFEVLASLAYFERHEENDLTEFPKNNISGQIAPMPIGRIGWNTSTFKVLLQELQSELQSSQLLSVGFSHGSSTFLKLYIRNLEACHVRMSW